jgi:hypothetical protein
MSATRERRSPSHGWKRFILAGTMAMSLTPALPALADPAPLRLPDVFSPESPFFMTVSTRLARPDLLAQLGLGADRFITADASGSAAAAAIDAIGSAWVSDLQKDFGVTFAGDVAPWLGGEMALSIDRMKQAAPKPKVKPTKGHKAASKMDLDDFDVLFAVSVADHTKAQAFLDRVTTAKKGQVGWKRGEVEGVATLTHAMAKGHDTMSLALCDDVLLASDDPQELSAAIHRAKTHTPGLSSNADFAMLLRHHSDQALGFAYLGHPVFKALANLVVDHKGPITNADRTMQEAFAPLSSAAIDMGYADHAFALNSYIHYDTTQLKGVMASWLKDSSTPVPSARMDALGPDAVAFSTFRFPQAFREAFVSGLHSEKKADRKLAELKKNKGLDLEKDLTALMDGEGAIALLRREDSGLPLPYCGYLALHPADVAKAQAGLKDMANFFSKAMSNGKKKHAGSFATETHGGMPWTVYHTDKGPGLAGFGSKGDGVYLALGSGAMEQIGSGTTAATRSVALTNVLSHLPDPNGGVIFIDVGTIMGDVGPMLQALASDKAGDKADAMGDAFGAVNRVEAIAFATQPGLDADGVFRGRMVLTIKK